MLACAAKTQPPPVVASGENTPAPPSSIAGEKPCSVTADDQCYASSEEACKAIGCSPGHCEVSYSHPMEASCS
jgi:hypothetical protein